MGGSGGRCHGFPRGLFSKYTQEFTRRSQQNIRIVRKALEKRSGFSLQSLHFFAIYSRKNFKRHSTSLNCRFHPRHSLVMEIIMSLSGWMQRKSIRGGMNHLSFIVPLL